MKLTEIPLFETKKELFKFLKENKSLLMMEKKSAMKHADAISFMCPLFDDKSQSFKAASEVSKELLNKEELQAKVAINSTNLLDSHKDVHIPGLWKKSLKESGKRILHLQEHNGTFKGIIADGMDGDVKAYTEMMKWKDLGYDFKGESEVLTFDSVIRKTRNEEMFNAYAKGYVKNHSVGMMYVKMVMCINSEEKYYIEEKEAWDEYYSQVVNSDAADECGYFWAVTEAKAFEGSAVPRGSNFVTPTIEIKSEPGDHSQTKPGKSTFVGIDYDYLLKNL